MAIDDRKGSLHADKAISNALSVKRHDDTPPSDCQPNYITLSLTAPILPGKPLAFNAGGFSAI